MSHDPPGGKTVTFAAAPTAATGTAPPIVPGSGFEEELRQLLRSRLILVHAIAWVYVTLLVAVVLILPADVQTTHEHVDFLLVGSLVQSLSGIAVLGRAPGMSLRALRAWELFHFGTQAAVAGGFRFAMLATATGEAPSEFQFRGAVSLIGIMTIILAYGVMIPSTRERSLRVVTALVAVPFTALTAATFVNPALQWSYCAALVFQTAANLFLPTAIAVFAATRAANLHRRAYDAEKRANEVGPYALKEKLGEGGMGEVWLAEHRLLKRPCAVKFIRPELATNPSTAARFEREVQAVTALTHFNTVRVYDYGRADDGSFYYVMEYLDGPTLESLVRRAGPLGPARAVYLLRQLCGALAEAHEAGLVHRDVKPGNVIVSSLGGLRDVVKLLDFGLVQDLATADTRLTAAGVVLGTPAYMSPEQAGGSVAVDARGDVYALGVIAFFMLAGRPPFEKATIGEYIAAHLTEDPPRVCDLRPEVPGDLAAVVARCLAKKPAERFQSVAELDAALRGCACSGGWSAESARTWWDESASAPPPPDATATYHRPEGTSA
jgi:eukaryotic-like serine/threonine-protein kinase